MKIPTGDRTFLTDEDAIAGKCEVHTAPAWNVGIIVDAADSTPIPFPLKAWIEIHKAGSLQARQETGKSESVAILRYDGNMAGFFTVRELEHYIKLMKGE